MNDEVERSDDGYSLRQILELVVRRKRAIIQTFFAVVLLGCLITWLSRPVYRSASQVLVQSNRSALSNLDIDLPFKDLIQSSSGRSIDTQKILIRSKAVVTRACEIAKIPYREVASGRIRVSSDDLPETDVIELSVDSTSADHALRMINAVIRSFRENVQTSRQK